MEAPQRYDLDGLENLSIPQLEGRRDHLICEMHYAHQKGHAVNWEKYHREKTILAEEILSRYQGHADGQRKYTTRK